MMGPHGGNRKHSKDKIDAKSLKKLFRYMTDYKVALIFVIIITISSTVFNVYAPIVLGNTTDIMLDSYNQFSTVLSSALMPQIYKLIIIYLSLAGLTGIQNVIMVRISNKMIYTLRSDVSKKINKLPVNYYDKRQYGDILSIVTNDIETIYNSISSSITSIIKAFATLIGIVIVMISIDIAMSMIVFVSILLSGLVIMIVVKKSQKYFFAQQNKLAELNGHVEEIYSNHNIVTAFNGQDKALEQFNVINEDLKDSSFKSQFYSSLMMPLSRFISSLAYVAVIVVGALRALSGNISIGNIQSFVIYTNKMNEPIQTLSQVVTTLQSASAASKRVFDLLEADELSEDKHDDELPEIIQGSVEFKHVKFGYSDDNILMNDINFTVKSGQMVAIVGPTGAGKTTLVNLLMRFYDVKDGSINIDGVNINDIPRHMLRGKFGMVLQDTWLTNESIRKNVAFTKDKIDDDKVKQACETANIDHFIRSLSEGYHTKINDQASNVSQGEKQLLTIARAFYSAPQMLILDEATSNVDTRTEILIQQAMERLTKGQTSFVIAHRLSTIKNADIIIVMDHGNIIETGSHDELLSQNGFYKDLYMSQFEEN